MNPVDPNPGQIGKGGEVVVGRQELGLEASHLAGGRGLLRHGSASNNPPHGRIVSQAVGVVDILVAAEPPEGGLAKQAGHPVLSVLAGSWVHKPLAGHLRQSEGFVKLPEGKKPGIGRDLGTVELQLQPSVEIQPQHPRLTFTHRVSHPNPSNSTTTH